MFGDLFLASLGHSKLTQFIRVLPALTFFVHGCGSARNSERQTYELSYEVIRNEVHEVHESGLDSLCTRFRGDTLFQLASTTGIRVHVLDCPQDSLHMLNPYAYWGIVDVEAEFPCTLTVALTDSSGLARRWHHYALAPSPSKKRLAVESLFSDFVGIRRYNILVRGKLILACDIPS